MLLGSRLATKGKSGKFDLYLTSMRYIEVCHSKSTRDPYGSAKRTQTIQCCSSNSNFVVTWEVKMHQLIVLMCWEMS